MSRGRFSPYRKDEMAGRSAVDPRKGTHHMKPLRATLVLFGLAALWPALVSSLAFVAQFVRYRTLTHGGHA